jgi:glycosyltransferase involved in cell wall biosynthesis
LLRVTGLNWSDAVGSRFNLVDVHEDLLLDGIDYHLIPLVRNEIEETWIHPQKFLYKENNFRKTILKFEEYSGHLSTFQVWDRRLTQERSLREADLIHFQILHNGNFRLETAEKIARNKPVVWSLHDPWMSTGHCIHPTDCNRWRLGCGSCPDLSRAIAVKRDRTSQEKVRKSRIIEKINPIIHVSTIWMRDLVLESLPVAPDRVHIIPFGIDLSLFQPNPYRRAAIRKRLGISDETIVMFLRQTLDPNKGYLRAIEAIVQLSKSFKITLITVEGQGLTPDLPDNLQIIEFPFISDQTLLANLYSAADYGLSFSIAETFGMMALELMASGKPVFYFDDTATHEILKSKYPFALPRNSCTEDVSDAIKAAICNEKSTSLEAQRLVTRAEQTYSKAIFTRSMANLFKHTQGIYEE